MAMLSKNQPTLDERVKAIRPELDAWIDERAAEIKKTCPGVPVEVIRNLLTARSGGCQCMAYLQIKKQDAENAAAEAAAAAA